MTKRPTNGNTGIQMSGRATINSQVVVVGNHARAVVNTATAALEEAGQSDLATRLEEVLAALQRDGAALPDPDTATGYMTMIAEEAAKDKPKKLTLTSFVSSLAEQVKSVAAIATAVAALGASVHSLF